MILSFILRSTLGTSEPGKTVPIKMKRPQHSAGAKYFKEIPAGLRANNFFIGIG